MKAIIIVLSIVLLSGCVAMPHQATHQEVLNNVYQQSLSTRMMAVRSL